MHRTKSHPVFVLHKSAAVNMNVCWATLKFASPWFPWQNHFSIGFGIIAEDEDYEQQKCITFTQINKLTHQW